MIKVAAYQVPLLPSGSMAALELIARRVRWCEAREIAILCCPEAVLGGLADDSPSPRKFAISVGGGALARLLAPLGSRSVTIIIGFTEAGPDGRLYNSAAVFFEGALRGVYRKRHPAIRSSVYAAGGDSPVFHASGLAFGILICNDSNFPELGAGLAARGAKALFVPTNNALRADRADVVARVPSVDRALAADHGVTLVRADVAGRLGERLSYGSSAITAPGGRLVQAGRRLSEDLLVATIDPQLAP